MSSRLVDVETTESLWENYCQQRCLRKNVERCSTAKIVCLLVPEESDRSDKKSFFEQVFTGYSSERDLILDEFTAHKDHQVFFRIDRKVVSIKGWDLPSYAQRQKKMAELKREVEESIETVSKAMHWSEDDHIFFSLFIEGLARLSVIGYSHLEEPIKHHIHNILKYFHLYQSSKKSIFQNTINSLVKEARSYLDLKKNQYLIPLSSHRLAHLVETIKTHAAAFEHLFVVIRSSEFLLSEQATHLSDELQSAGYRYAILASPSEEPAAAPLTERNHLLFHYPLTRKAPFNHNIPDLDTRHSHYLVLKALEKGNKLQVDYQANGQSSLSISLGNNQNLLGWATQAASRKMANFMGTVSASIGGGFTEAHHEAVIHFLKREFQKDKEMLIAINEILEQEEVPIKELNEILLKLITFEGIVTQAREKFIKFIDIYYYDVCYKEFASLSMALQSFDELNKAKALTLETLFFREVNIQFEKLVNWEKSLNLLAQEAVCEGA